LKLLKFSYCPKGGSSRGIRQFLASEELKKFKETNPQVEVVSQEKLFRHPFVEGEYVHGNLKKIVVKNTEPKEIMEKLIYLRNQWGNHGKTWNNRQYTQKPSIQGPWNQFKTY